MARLARLLVPSLLLIHAALLAYGAWVHSPTLNEPAHFVAGISNWEFGRFDVYCVNPPLVRMVAALPAICVGCQTDWSDMPRGPGGRSEFALGEDFVAANGQRSFWLMTLARWACIPFGLLGGYVCYRWARDLYQLSKSEVRCTKPDTNPKSENKNDPNDGYGAEKGSVPICSPTTSKMVPAANGDRPHAYAAGLLALTLWCFCPNIVAHGQLITSDVAATSLAVAACYTFWRWLRRPTWMGTIVSGLALGVAELAKTTLVIFYPLWPLIWLIYRLPDRQKMHGRDWLRELGMLSLRILLALYLVNLGCGFEGSGKRLGDFIFVSGTLAGPGRAEKVPLGGGNRFIGSWIENLPVPLPENYVLGIDLQKRDFESYGQPSYLRGEFSERGWWYYYLYALAIKVPLGTWVLIGLAATRRWWWPRGTSSRHGPSVVAAEGKENEAAALANGMTQRVPSVPATWRDEFILLCPAIVILAFVSTQSGFSQHMRYVLPVFPFVFVWIGRVAVAFDGLGQRLPFLRRPDTRHQILQTTGQWTITIIAITALLWSITSSLLVYPHSLSYFNELAGGPAGGPVHLIHSNVDWGQDLLKLKRWLDEHPEARPLKLAYFGYFDPHHMGIEYTLIDEKSISSRGTIPPGWYAISVNFVRGFPYAAYKGDGTRGHLSQNALIAFQELTPVATTGYSIYIYHVPDSPVSN